MALTTVSVALAKESSNANTVLVVSQDGAVRSVVEATDALRKQFEQAPTRLNINELWPSSMVTRTLASVQRAVRSRKSSSEQVDDPVDGRSYDIIYLPQGPDRVMVIIRDLSEHQIAFSRARKLAYMDEATGLPNREYLFGELKKIADMQSLKGGRAALICIHVGQFDDHGWALNSSQQDEVLKELASRMTANLRGSNDEIERDCERYSVAARTDFRQFCVVLPSIESGEDAEAVIERLIRDLGQPVTTGARTITVLPRGGVALFPQDGTDPAALFENAVAAMEDARNDSDSSFKFHSGTVRLRTLQRQDLEVELKSALQKEEYTLNFLPIVDAVTERPAILEALLRWPDTMLGVQPTRKIVRVAERTGLMLPIGEWVVRRACHQLQRWRSAGYVDIRLAINLSSQELVSDGIAGRIAQILQDTGTEPNLLDIELKEHMLFREVLKDYETCRQLKALGFRIVIDDFGIGACSLADLSQCPADAIKIDNTFIASLETDARSRAACGAAIAMARELGIEVIAEGVETAAQARILRDVGCGYLQGFHFSKPMTEGETIDYLAGAGHVHSADGVRLER